jgi:hypothetical protein
MVLIQKSYDPDKLKELGLEIEGEIIKEKETGIVVPETDSRIKDVVKSKINWNWIGPAIAVTLFVLGWVTVVSERAWTATVNTDSIAKQEVKIGNQEVQIESLKKANERQEIMMQQQTQIIDKQDKVMETREKYADKRLENVERGVVDELRALRLTIESLRLEIRGLKQK